MLKNMKTCIYALIYYAKLVASVQQPGETCLIIFSMLTILKKVYFLLPRKVLIMLDF